MSTILQLVKQRLNRLDNNLDAYLINLIEACRAELNRKGINLQDDIDDTMLLVDYTVWRYQSRDKDGGMPQWLSLRIRERWLSLKGRETDDA